ncbi:hypothetical protein OIU74_004377 [Salix koriyanagi]|uniref:Uncharacterized protein n=1 Tax=Salix koriyanagi TaxID=2511006 RepID=A0A9Q0ZM14_9ROSI|nr:hypothetical protein OIU74_004377 [Salix koriyanagi]
MTRHQHIGRCMFTHSLSSRDRVPLSAGTINSEIDDSSSNIYAKVREISLKNCHEKEDRYPFSVASRMWSILCRLIKLITMMCIYRLGSLMNMADSLQFVLVLLSYIYLF